MTGCVHIPEICWTASCFDCETLIRQALAAVPDYFVWGKGLACKGSHACAAPGADSTETQETCIQQGPSFYIKSVAASMHLGAQETLPEILSEIETGALTFLNPCLQQWSLLSCARILRDLSRQRPLDDGHFENALFLLRCRLGR